MNDFEKMNFDDDFNFDNELVAESKVDERNPISSRLKAGSTEFMEAFNIREDPNIVTDILKKSLPDDINRFVNDATSATDDVMGEIEKQIKPTKKALYDITNAIGNMSPNIPMVKDAIETLKDKLRVEDDDYIRVKTENEALIEEAKLSADETFSEMTQLSLKQDEENARLSQLGQKNTNELLAVISNNSKVSRDVAVEYSVGYYKRSIELKYRHIFLTENLLKSTRVGIETISRLLDNIVHNTALPDIIKAKSSEAIAHAAKMQVGAEASKMLFSSTEDGIFGNFTKRVKGKIRDGVDKLKDIAGMSDMFDEEMGNQLSLHSYVASSTAGQLKDIASETIRKKLAKTKAGRKALKEINTLEMDPKEYLRSKKGKSKLVNGLLDTLSELVSNTNTEGGYSFRAERNNIPTQFDKLTRDSIVKSIPTLLSEILTSVKSIELGKQQEKLTYDLGTNQIVMKDSLVTSTVKAFESKLDENTYAYRSFLDDKFRSDMGPELFEKFIRRVTEFAFEGKSFIPSRLDENGFFNGFSKDDKKTIKASIKRKTRSKVPGKSGELEREIHKAFTGIKHGIEDPTQFLKEAESTGVIGQLVNAGMVEFDDKTKTYSINRDKYKDMVSSHISKNDLTTANKRSAANLIAKGFNESAMVKSHQKQLEKLKKETKSGKRRSILSGDKFKDYRTTRLNEWTQIYKSTISDLEELKANYSPELLRGITKKILSSDEFITELQDTPEATVIKKQKEKLDKITKRILSEKVDTSDVEVFNIKESKEYKVYEDKIDKLSSEINATDSVEEKRTLFAKQNELKMDQKSFLEDKKTTYKSDTYIKMIEDEMEKSFKKLMGTFKYEPKETRLEKILSLGSRFLNMVPDKFRERLYKDYVYPNYRDVEDSINAASDSELMGDSILDKQMFKNSKIKEFANIGKVEELKVIAKGGIDGSVEDNLNILVNKFGGDENTLNNERLKYITSDKKYKQVHKQTKDVRSSVAHAAKAEQKMIKRELSEEFNNIKFLELYTRDVKLKLDSIINEHDKDYDVIVKGIKLLSQSRGLLMNTYEGKLNKIGRNLYKKILKPFEKELQKLLISLINEEKYVEIKADKGTDNKRNMSDRVIRKVEKGINLDKKNISLREQGKEYWDQIQNASNEEEVRNIYRLVDSNPDATKIREFISAFAQASEEDVPDELEAYKNDEDVSKLLEQPTLTDESPINNLGLLLEVNKEILHVLTFNGIKIDSNEYEQEDLADFRTQVLKELHRIESNTRFIDETYNYETDVELEEQRFNSMLHRQDPSQVPEGGKLRPERKLDNRDPITVDLTKIEDYLLSIDDSVKEIESCIDCFNEDQDDSNRIGFLGGSSGGPTNKLGTSSSEVREIRFGGIHGGNSRERSPEIKPIRPIGFRTPSDDATKINEIKRDKETSEVKRDNVNEDKETSEVKRDNVNEDKETSEVKRDNVFKIITNEFLKEQREYLSAFIPNLTREVNEYTQVTAGKLFIDFNDGTMKENINKTFNEVTNTIVEEYNEYGKEAVKGLKTDLKEISEKTLKVIKETSNEQWQTVKEEVPLYAKAFKDVAKDQVINTKDIFHKTSNEAKELTKDAEKYSREKLTEIKELITTSQDKTTKLIDNVKEETSSIINVSKEKIKEIRNEIPTFVETMNGYLKILSTNAEEEMEIRKEEEEKKPNWLSRFKGKTKEKDTKSQTDNKNATDNKEGFLSKAFGFVKDLPFMGTIGTALAAGLAAKLLADPDSPARKFLDEKLTAVTSQLKENVKESWKGLSTTGKFIVGGISAILVAKIASPIFSLGKKLFGIFNWLKKKDVGDIIIEEGKKTLRSLKHGFKSVVNAITNNSDDSPDIGLDEEDKKKSKKKLSRKERRKLARKRLLKSRLNRGRKNIFKRILNGGKEFGGKIKSIVSSAGSVATKYAKKGVSLAVDGAKYVVKHPGKVAKKIPGVAAVVGAGYIANDLWNGEYRRAGYDLAEGVVGNIPYAGAVAQEVISQQKDDPDFINKVSAKVKEVTGTTKDEEKKVDAELPLIQLLTKYSENKDKIGWKEFYSNIKPAYPETSEDEMLDQIKRIERRRGTLNKILFAYGQNKDRMEWSKFYNHLELQYPNVSEEDMKKVVDIAENMGTNAGPEKLLSDVKDEKGTQEWVKYVRNLDYVFPNKNIPGIIDHNEMMDRLAKIYPEKSDIELNNILTGNVKSAKLESSIVSKTEPASSVKSLPSKQDALTDYFNDKSIEKKIDWIPFLKRAQELYPNKSESEIVDMLKNMGSAKQVSVFANAVMNMPEKTFEKIEKEVSQKLKTDVDETDALLNVHKLIGTYYETNKDHVVVSWDAFVNQVKKDYPKVSEDEMKTILESVKKNDDGFLTKMSNNVNNLVLKTLANFVPTKKEEEQLKITSDDVQTNIQPISMKTQPTENAKTNQKLSGVSNGGAYHKADYHTKVEQLRVSDPWLFQNIGKPYTWGNPVGPKSMDFGFHPGYDCSGLTSSWLGRQGIGLNSKGGTMIRTADYQYRSKMFDHFMDIGKAKPGDLVWFYYHAKGRLADHVGIYLGDGWMIHANGTTHNTAVTHVFMGNYKKHFIGFGRYNGSKQGFNYTKAELRKHNIGTVPTPIKTKNVDIAMKKQLDGETTKHTKILNMVEKGSLKDSDKLASGVKPGGAIANGKDPQLDEFLDLVKEHGIEEAGAILANKDNHITSDSIPIKREHRENKEIFKSDRINLLKTPTIRKTKTITDLIEERASGLKSMHKKVNTPTQPIVNVTTPEIGIDMKPTENGISDLVNLQKDNNTLMEKLIKRIEKMEKQEPKVKDPYRKRDHFDPRKVDYSHNKRDLSRTSFN